MTTTQDVTIPAGASLSTPVDLSTKQTRSPLVLVSPAEWTPALITFRVSVDAGATWHDLYDPKAHEVMFDVSADRAYWLNRDSVFIPFGWMQFRSGTGERPIAQAETRVFTLVFADQALEDE